MLVYACQLYLVPMVAVVQLAGCLGVVQRTVKPPHRKKQLANSEVRRSVLRRLSEQCSVPLQRLLLIAKQLLHRGIYQRRIVAQFFLSNLHYWGTLVRTRGLHTLLPAGTPGKSCTY